MVGLQIEFEGKIMSEAWSTGFMDAESKSYNPPEGNKDINIEYKRGYEIRLQQLATSVEKEREGRLGKMFYGEASNGRGQIIVNYDQLLLPRYGVMPEQPRIARRR